jgi:multidrug efflux system outer membrane protein
MTSLAFIFGVVPLVFATGAGAEMRRALGTAVFSGMLGVTLFGIFLTPVFYVAIRWATERRRRHAAPVVGAVAAALIFIQGCSVGPDFKKPATVTSERFLNDAAPQFSTNATEIQWWRGFNDPKLETLIAQALTNNHDLRIAAANLREARALRRLNRFDLFPTVTASAGYTDRQNSSTVFRGDAVDADRGVELYDARFDATWELDIFGRVRRSVEATAAEVEAARASLRDVQVSVISEVARNYMELRGSQNQLNVARSNAENSRETLRITEARLGAGRGTELDTARAAAQMSSTFALIPPLETDVARAAHRLSVLVGEQPGVLAQSLASAGSLPAPPQVIAIGNPEALLRRRADIRMAEQRLAAATARIGVATADLFPRVTFNGSVGLEAATFAGLGDTGSDTWSFGPRITWAAFDLGRVRARIDAADARAQGALAAYERTVLTTLEETENALVTLTRETARLAHLRDAVRASETAANLARLRFEAGGADFLAVLDAERVLLNARDQLAQAETRAANASISVYKALGGGWEETHVRAEN